MKYALITGGTSGIGAAYARELARRGYNIVITGRRREVIEKTAAEIRKRFKVEVEVVLADFTQREDVDRLLKRAEEMDIEFLVNNVGFGNKKVFLEDTYEEQRKMLDVQIDAMCRITHMVSKKMKASGRGNIINVSSLAAFTPASFNHLYSASKSFIVTFSEALHIDLMESGVGVQVVCPGFTKTDFHREMEMEEKTFENRGLVRWMEAERVVEISLKKLEKGGGVCIPGICNKILYLLLKFLPKGVYYKMAKRMSM